MALQHRTLYRIKACNTDLFGSTNFSPRQQRLKDLPTSKLQTKDCRISGVCLGQARAKGAMHFFCLPDASLMLTFPSKLCPSNSSLKAIAINRFTPPQNTRERVFRQTQLCVAVFATRNILVVWVAYCEAAIPIVNK